MALVEHGQYCATGCRNHAGFSRSNILMKLLFDSNWQVAMIEGWDCVATESQVQGMQGASVKSRLDLELRSNPLYADNLSFSVMG